MKRVVITGMGIWSCLGVTLDEDSCHLWIPEKTMEAHFDTFLSNSFGFGGTNSTLIIRNV